MIICLDLLHAQIGDTYINPVIPGDHPDPTLTKIGSDFYTSGSSFNPTPKIYHSTDLVHWEVISQPVSSTWDQYGNSPGGGIWGGHMVLYNGTYWHYFGRGGGSMYFVTAQKPEGPWSDPTQVNVPSSLSSKGIGLGVDNSIFIDDDNKWYMLTKAGRQNNFIVELGNDGQPNGNVLDLTWLNPDSEGNPYGWAEGPVMWKHNGYYYYSFAQHLAGSQYVMRSESLTDNKSDWTIIGTNIFKGTTGVFSTPNHISPAVTLDDGTSWVIAHSYRSGWLPHGRQGLLCEVTYNAENFPEISRPSIEATTAPDLPSSGIPWTGPHSDDFNSEIINPEWSFLGYTYGNSYSLTEKPGWIKLSTLVRSARNTIIKNDGEHNFSLITKMDFDPVSTGQEAGLWIINGPQSHQVKVYSSINSEGNKVLSFSFKESNDETIFEVENSIGNVVWLKLIRDEHLMSGYYSSDGYTWEQIGDNIDAANIDLEQAQFNNFTGNQQGLYTIGKEAYFDLYIYRDAFTPITAINPANQSGTKTLINRQPPNTLGNISNNDWVMYAGIEFGNTDYPKQADSISISASCNSSGGTIEMVLDSLSGEKIGELQIKNTGSWDEYESFTTNVIQQVSDNHDLFLLFKGSDSELFRLQTITFIEIDDAPTSVGGIINTVPIDFKLDQNFPNPFNPTTKIRYSIGQTSIVTLKVYDLLGREIQTLVNSINSPGTYSLDFAGTDLSSGIYFYQLKADKFIDTKKLVFLK